MILLAILALALFLCYKILDHIVRLLEIDGISHKYVFITGCDTGFGHDLALHLDRIGFNVFAGCFSEEGQNSLTKDASSRLIALPLDVAKSESIREAVDLVKEKLPPNTGLWALVNNAGVAGAMGPVEFCSLQDYYDTLAVNLFGPIEMCKQFLPLVRKSQGRVVNMASAMGRIMGEAGPYGVSKFGIEAYSDGLRRDLYHLGVKVSILEPGFFKTHVVSPESLDNTLVKFFNSAEEEVQNAYGGEKYVKRRLKLYKGTRHLASKDLSIVVKAYTHAIVSRFPRTRYVVGWDAKLLYIPLSMIPTGITDWIMTTLNSL